MSQNIIDTLTGSLNASGSFSETYGILNSNIWDHPEVAGEIIVTTFGAGGLTFKRLSTGEFVSINFSDLFALATTLDGLLLPQAAAPLVLPASGAHPQTVSMSCSHPAGSIYYTTNGSTPTSASTLYTAPITVSSALTLKAINIKQYWRPSAVTTCVYT